MAKTNVGIIDVAVYENGSEYLGMAQLGPPTIAAKTLTATGMGIGGDVEVPVEGHKGTMSFTLNFIDAPLDSRRAVTHGCHTFDCRVARENLDPSGPKYVITPHRYVLTGLPKTETLGNLAPASQQGASNEYSCISYKEYIDNTLVRHVDPVNYIDVDANGVDSLAEVRAALGK